MNTPRSQKKTGVSPAECMQVVDLGASTFNRIRTGHKIVRGYLTLNPRFFSLFLTYDGSFPYHGASENSNKRDGDLLFVP